MESGGQMTNEARYPVQFSVEYPDRDLNRLTSAFRIFVAIPILIVLGAVSNGWAGWGWGDWEGGGIAAGAGGVLFLPPLLMIVFRKKYPRWWFDWNLELLRFENRVVAYVALMDDRYPSTDERQAVTLEFPYPDARQELNRWLPLVKWFLAIPHYIVLVFLTLAAFVSVVIAWFAILFTGRYPRGLFDFVLGVMRWGNRVQAYAFILVTDRYPPFRLGA
jgi:small-conductance mechanosensitive channel